MEFYSVGSYHGSLVTVVSICHASCTMKSTTIKLCKLLGYCEHEVFYNKCFRWLVNVITFSIRDIIRLYVVHVNLWNLYFAVIGYGYACMCTRACVHVYVCTLPWSWPWSCGGDQCALELASYRFTVEDGMAIHGHYY